MHRFYAPISDFHDERVILAAEETHHLRDVLRLETGDDVRVFNGEGTEFLCRVQTLGKKETQLLIVETVEPSAPESDLDLNLACGILKGEKFDLVIQKAVELGVKRFVPLYTSRCAVKIRDGETKLKRWRRIALDAAKQCGRANLMTVSGPYEFLCFLDQPEAEWGERILFAERGGENSETMAKCKKITAFVGPEGGWDEVELNAAFERSLVIVTLGGRILRAETAAISIAAILQHRFGDLI